ncbi:tRNA (adenosine(37)-N6)-threonylcarbamoyltransferase complex dimerization subunit type 1 TsaB [Arenimonas sp. GDDSR-1]|uniref:tRNA (adenosine(37)-N6)-threonylcarbamoyltransferase complex dimerization subunit type 1 TsaB n=1 Tax=Arenimonas sp. GDDSR-1 TaxID=2950125 RepID=UPI00260D0027|nr:tRNA (adenosine(37)-N6)-threonylcarbamoyltransferase complex dimerization subunit type 1 TsaB [Arenimonas sp. GDDSR-1]
MNLLVLDTSTEACAVGVAAGGRHFGRFELTPRRHTDCVLPWSDQLLAQAGLSKSALQAIGVGIGPGAFTGVRLAVSLAQGMALALNLPVVPISTLAAIAQAQDHDGPMAVAMDARMGECYVGYYQKRQGIAEALVPERLLKPDDIALPFAGDWIGVGSAFGAYAALLPTAFTAVLQRIDADALPQPEALLQLTEFAYQNGRGLPPEQIEPTYLRDKVALTLVERAGN